MRTPSVGSPSLGAALALTLAARSALAFTFNLTKPTQCEDLTVQWTGGIPPFHLALVPTISMTAGRIMNVSLPATGGPPYSYSFSLMQPAGLELMAILSDASGWASGGASDVLTVASSTNRSCLNAEVKADFWFWTDPVDSPPMCGNMKVQWEPNATYPIALYGVIPGGTAWEIPVPQTKSNREANWKVNIHHGTKFVLLMSDAGPYGTGGSTTPLTVQYSDDSSCLNDLSPSYTSSVPSPTASPSSTPKKSGSNAAAIGGAVGGVIGGLILLGLLLFCFCRRRRGKKADRDDKDLPTMRRGLLDRFSNHRLSGGSGTRVTSGTSGATNEAYRPRSWEIEAFEGLPGGEQPPEILDNDPSGENIPINPYPPAQQTRTPHRNSFISTLTDTTTDTKDRLPQSPAASTSRLTTGSRRPVQSGSRLPAPSTAPTDPASDSQSELYTVAEVRAIAAAANRDELLNMIDPPPKYNAYTELRAANPDN